MKFLCDDNLGKLAKYLRMLGFDTFFKSVLSDAELLAVMLKEKRFVLTRDHNLAKRIEPGRYQIIKSDVPEEQLREVFSALSLKIETEALFSRCLECNEVCVEVSKDEIKDEVFPYIVKKHEVFRRCPVCRRVYWQGSHYKDMMERLMGVVGGI
jgi:uncharacterized protein with PIN domain